MINMKEFKLRSDDEFIKLGQLLKACNIVGSGVEAKIQIKDGLVKVNDEVSTERGKKIREGDVVSCGLEKIKVVK